PPDALPVIPKISITPAEAQALALEQPAPVYPPIALAARVQGVVELEIYLGDDGHVLYMRAIDGPLMLLQAAVDGVNNWVYKPYTVDGRAVEVKTTVKVLFPLYGRPHAVN